MLSIDRCVCRNVLFAELLPKAQEKGWDLDALIQETGCGGKCGLCRPYLRRMLTNGQVEFHEILTD